MCGGWKRPQEDAGEKETEFRRKGKLKINIILEENARSLKDE